MSDSIKHVNKHVFITTPLFKTPSVQQKLAYILDRFLPMTPDPTYEPLIVCPVVQFFKHPVSTEL